MEDFNESHAKHHDIHRAQFSSKMHHFPTKLKIHFSQTHGAQNITLEHNVDNL